MIDKKMRGPQFGPDQRVRRGGHLEGIKKGVNDNDKRCQVVEDVNLQLGSEEWLIRRHLQVNGNHILCDTIHSVQFKEIRIAVEDHRARITWEHLDIMPKRALLKH